MVSELVTHDSAAGSPDMHAILQLLNPQEARSPKAGEQEDVKLYFVSMHLATHSESMPDQMLAQPEERPAQSLTEFPMSPLIDAQAVASAEEEQSTAAATSIA